jgi:hypothetical protein
MKENPKFERNHEQEKNRRDRELRKLEKGIENTSKRKINVGDH